MSDKPDLEHGVYRVMHSLVRGGVRYICESDLIFKDGRPFVVLEWAGSPGTLYPDRALALDPARLREGSGPRGYFVCMTAMP